MDTGIYRRLAQKLDAIPNGFPQTESSVELKLLAKMFTVEEAVLASEMRLTPETAGQIAKRTKTDPKKTKALLEEMVRHGLIRKRGEGNERRFSLMPFVVGIYEMQLNRLDRETALLFEEYYESFAKGVLSMTPSLHVVIPVEKSIPFEVQVFPYEQASQLLEKAKSFGVRRCICRLQRRLAGKPCKYPEETCLVFAPFEHAFERDSDIRVLTEEEALTLLRDTEKAGLIHSSANIQEGHSYICNCCTCCCGIMRGIAELGIENSAAKSDFLSQVDPELCTGCGACQKRCQFNALTLTDNTAQVNKRRCVGCGQCAITCPFRAIRLVRKTKNRSQTPPKDYSEWMSLRAKNRGIRLQEVL
jgi:electron transport complex protein RnfB